MTLHIGSRDTMFQTDYTDGDMISAKNMSPSPYSIVSTL